MKKIFFIIPLSLSIAVMACSNANEAGQATTAQQQKTGSKQDVNVNEFDALIANGDGQILDVRTPEEWTEGVIEGAIKMNFFDADFQEQIKKLDASKPVYVYCKSGGRSGQTAAQLQTMGFTVHNLSGGMNAWNRAGKDVVK